MRSTKMSGGVTLRDEFEEARVGGQGITGPIKRTKNDQISECIYLKVFYIALLILFS